MTRIDRSTGHDDVAPSAPGIRSPRVEGVASEPTWLRDYSAGSGGVDGASASHSTSRVTSSRVNGASYAPTS